MSINAINDFFVFALVHFFATIGPGVGSFYVITKTITHGKSVGSKSANMIAISDTIYAGLVIFEVSSIIKTNPQLYRYIEIICSIYLLTLGLYIIKSSFQNGKLKSFDCKIGNNKFFLNNVYLSAFIVAASNLKVFILFISLLLDPLENINLNWRLFYFFWIFIVNIICYNLLKLISLQRDLQKIFISKMSIINIIFAVFLLFSGIKLLIFG